MAIANGYCTLAQLKARLDVDTAVTAWDTPMEGLIEAVSRWIDGHTGRRFYAATETRYYTAVEADLLEVDDLLTVTTLKTLSANASGTRTYGYSWAATDYDLRPYNSTPKTMVALNPGGSYTFPLDARGVEINGSWGYAAAAVADVVEACVIQCGQQWGEKGAPFGEVKAPDVGETWVVSRVHPRVWQLLAPLRRLGFAAV